jgi:protein-S-isoprenylcysteine O-methyltransferase Ste14
MASLELLIPPPAVALIVAAAMWGASGFVPSLEVPSAVRVVSASTIALIGLGIDLAGILSFWRAKTTLNPMNPAGASSLVTSGIYKATRNPMYVGLLFLLVAWAVYLSSAWLLLGPVAFILYLNRYQIEPEERILLATFGDRYSEYTARVRRWL